MRTRRFRAMGTEVRVITPPGDRNLGRTSRLVEEIFAREEHRFSRFLPESELSLVNSSAGRWVAVSTEMTNVLALALSWAHRTEGLFDPTLLHALEAAGYDRTFEAITLGPRMLDGGPTGGWRGIEVEEGRVRLPEGVGLDLGGLVKGWTVDRAVEALGPDPWMIVDAGGDLRLGGIAEDGVEIAIEDPFDPGAELLRVRLSGGALATSSVMRRAWGPGLHHLIDPRTGEPLRSDVVQATAWADTAAAAEVLAKSALFSGGAALEEFPGVVVLEDGEVLVGMAEGQDAA